MAKDSGGLGPRSRKNEWGKWREASEAARKIVFGAGLGEEEPEHLPSGSPNYNVVYQEVLSTRHSFS